MKLQIENLEAGASLNCDGRGMEISAASSLDAFRQMQAKIILAAAFSGVVYKTEPILLFSGPEKSLPTTTRSQFADFIITVAHTCQCLFSYSDVNIFPDDVSARHYTAADLDMT